MNALSFTQSEHTRAEVLRFIERSLSSTSWAANTQAISHLKQTTAEHILFQHPILTRLHQCQLSLEQLKFIHLNYITAIVKIFTDALSMAMYQALQLEHDSNIVEQDRIAAKIYARYLLSLNLLDELGFNTHQLEKSSPSKSHLVYFLQLMQQLELNATDQKQTEPEAFAISQFIQEHIHSYADLLLILACTELQVIKFSEALRTNLAAYDPLFTQGYYACHGLAETYDTTLANDDNHEDDIWVLFTQCYKPEQALYFQQLQTEYLSLWNNFWSKMNLRTH